jgi:hypothetical protein
MTCQALTGLSIRTGNPGPGRYVQDESRRIRIKKSEEFQRLLKILAGYPLAIEVVLGNLAIKNRLIFLLPCRLAMRILMPVTQDQRLIV